MQDPFELGLIYKGVCQPSYEEAVHPYLMWIPGISQEDIYQDENDEQHYVGPFGELQSIPPFTLKSLSMPVSIFPLSIILLPYKGIAEPHRARSGTLAISTC